MFTPSRFIAIDDERPHLEAITSALNGLGIPCLGMHYDGTGFQKAHFGGVRVLVLDLHLVAGVPPTDDHRHFGFIASLLVNHISPDGGPFIVVLWTQNPQQAAQLTAYIDETVTELHARPLRIIPLNKGDYLDLVEGTVKDLVKFSAAVQDHIVQNPQIHAILSWEAEVHAATSNTLASILRLVPPEERVVGKFSAALDKALSHLAVASAGSGNLEGNIRSAINGVLTPIISDRLSAMHTNEAEELWKLAVTQYKVEPDHLTVSAKAELNQMLHIEASGSGPDAWGAVVDFDPARTKELFAQEFDEILNREFKVNIDARAAACLPVLIRIGAVCDYAQRQPGPIPYILGIELTDLRKGTKRPDSVWSSPTISSDDKPCILLASARYPVVLSPSDAQKQRIRYRIREQLLMELIAKIGTHVTRPGKVFV